MSLPHTIVRTALAPKTRAVAFFGTSLAAAIGLYVAGSPEQGSQSGTAIAAGGPPVVRVDKQQPPPANVAAVDVSAAMKPVMAPAMPRDAATMIRQLQSALAHAHCYDGEISGVWTEASQAAMRSFVVSVNAQLPVTNPDAALLSLVASNSRASCASTAPVTTGALQAGRVEASADASPAKAAISITDSAEAAEVKAPSRLGMAWARSDMLMVPPAPVPQVIKNEVSPPQVEALIVGSSEPASEGEETQSKPRSAASGAPSTAAAGDTKREIALKTEPDSTPDDGKLFRKPAVDERETDLTAGKDDPDETVSKPKERTLERATTSKAAKSMAKKRSYNVVKQGQPKSLSKSLDSFARTVSSIFN